MATSKEPTLTEGVADNWQAGKTLAECNLRMLDKEDCCDVTFQCCEDRPIRAHRYMLMSRSCVFHAMFSDALEEIYVINVAEIDRRHFKQFLIYLYTDNTTVESDSVIPILYTSRKYAVTGLENKCLEFLKENLTVDNACGILEAAHHFDQKQLFEEALTLIKREGERSLQSAGFLALSQDLVDQIIESDDLVANEHVVFTAVNNWAEAECERQGRELTAEAKTSILGEMLKKVRFPLMKHNFLADDVKASGLLSDSERLKVIDHVLSPQNSVTTFNAKKRCGRKSTKTGQQPHEQLIQPKPKGRFLKTNALLSWNSGGKYQRKRPDAISFQSNKDLEICGCQLYGAFRVMGEYTYSVMVYLGSDDTVLNSLVQDKTTYIEQGEVYDVRFSKPVRITAGEWYTLVVKVTGPSSYRGKDGMALMVCEDGVQFQFRNSNRSKNGTDVTHGQIPSLIYRVL